VTGGIPVSQDGKSFIAVTAPNPIKNPALGSVIVNGQAVTPTGGPYTGSVIQATNGGTVTVGPQAVE
jgi:hypothetical protein